MSFPFCLPTVHPKTAVQGSIHDGCREARLVTWAVTVGLYRVCAVGSWRYGVTLLPGALKPDDERDEDKVDAVLRTRSENGWELVNAVSRGDGSDLLVFRRPAD